MISAYNQGMLVFTTTLTMALPLLKSVVLQDFWQHFAFVVVCKEWLTTNITRNKGTYLFIFALIKLLCAAHLSHTDHNLLLPLIQTNSACDELLIGEHLQKMKTFLSEQSFSLPKFGQE